VHNSGVFLKSVVDEFNVHIERDAEISEVSSASLLLLLVLILYLMLILGLVS